MVGTYRSNDLLGDSRRAYADLAPARRLLRADASASWIEVRLDDVRELQGMKQRLASRVGPDWIVIDLIEQNHDLIKALNTEKLMLFLAIGLIVVVAASNHAGVAYSRTDATDVVAPRPFAPSPPTGPGG